MENQNQPSLSKIFRETLKSKSCDIASVYHHIFSIKSDKDLDEHLSFMMEVKNGECDFLNKEDWFYRFHKSIRQADFFDNCHTIIEDPQITDEESKELDSLRTELDDFLKQFTIEEKRAMGGNYRILEQNRADDFKRLKTLNTKKQNKKTESISGHLDMILWNTIHLDRDGVLESVLKRTFNEYQFLLEESK